MNEYKKNQIKMLMTGLLGVVIGFVGTAYFAYMMHRLYPLLDIVSNRFLFLFSIVATYSTLSLTGMSIMGMLFSFNKNLFYPKYSVGDRLLFAEKNGKVEDPTVWHVFSIGPKSYLLKSKIPYEIEKTVSISSQRRLIKTNN